MECGPPPHAIKVHYMLSVYVIKGTTSLHSSSYAAFNLSPAPCSSGYGCHPGTREVAQRVQVVIARSRQVVVQLAEHLLQAA